MTDNTENVLLEMLKELRNDVTTFRTEMHDQLTDIRQRMLAIERSIGGIRRDIAEAYDNRVRLQASIDKLTARVERIERRLGLDA